MATVTVRRRDELVTEPDYPGAVRCVNTEAATYTFLVGDELGLVAKGNVCS